MKTFVVCLLCCIVSVADAQDYCKRLKKEDLGDKTMMEYTSPFDPQNLPAIRLQRDYSTDPDNPLDNFFMIFRIVGKLDDVYATAPDGGLSEKDEKKIVIEFEDKHRIEDPEIQVSHDVTDDKMQSIRYVYFPVNESNVKDLTTHTIARFFLAGTEQAVRPDSATALMQYVACLKALK